MKLVTFGIDQDRNLIIQFPVFVQPYTQKLLTLYQIETIPVPILDMIEKADSYTWIKIDKPSEHGCFSFCLVIMISVDFLNNRTKFC